jgi:tetratricopeptide (TPR) repeat protein
MEVSVRTPYQLRLAILFIAIFSASAALAQAADSFAAGEKYFLDAQPEKAIPLLEASIRENPGNEMAYYHLGLAYASVGRFDEGIAIAKKAASKFPEKNYEFYSNIGDFYFMQKKSSFAKEWYDQAIASNSEYAIAYLNRANVNMNIKDYPSAITDFKEYLDYEPKSAQREQIEKLIALLQGGIDEAERLKAAEAARLAAEEAKRQQMLADIAASLKDSASDTESLSVGTDKAEGYNDESDLAE